MPTLAVYKASSKSKYVDALANVYILTHSDSGRTSGENNFSYMKQTDARLSRRACQGITCRLSLPSSRWLCTTASSRPVCVGTPLTSVRLHFCGTKNAGRSSMSRKRPEQRRRPVTGLTQRAVCLFYSPPKANLPLLMTQRPAWLGKQVSHTDRLLRNGNKLDRENVVVVGSGSEAKGEKITFCFPPSHDLRVNQVLTGWVT